MQLNGFNVNSSTTKRVALCNRRSPFVTLRHVMIDFLPSERDIIFDWLLLCLCSVDCLICGLIVKCAVIVRSRWFLPAMLSISHSVVCLTVHFY